MANWKDKVREAAAAANHLLDEDIVEELAAHARAAFEAARAEGRSAAEATQQVSVLIDSWMQEAQRLRRRPQRLPAAIPPPASSAGRLVGILYDIRYAARILVRQKKYTALAVFTMALGIGILTTLCSVGYGVLLKPLPWPESDRLVRLTESRQGATRQFPWNISNGTYLAWADGAKTIETLGGWSTSTVTMTGVGDTSRITVSNVTASVFPLLRATPLMGSLFTAGDEPTYRGASKVLLSYGLWQERFGGNPQVLGQTVQFEGKAETIVGIMPRDFAFPDRATRAWIPYQVRPVATADGKGTSTQIFQAMARLRPGATPEQAAAEATARARTAPDGGLATTAIWGTNGPAQIEARPALEAMTAEVRPVIIALFVAVILLLLTATANVAGLQLAHAAARRREIAIRSAIGAGSWRIAQQLLTESVLLSMGGGLFGLLFALGMHRALPSILPSDFPRLDDVGMDFRVMLFSFAVTLLTGIAVGLVPALQMRRLSLVEAAVDSKHSRTPRMRTMIMVGQVAMACTLLVGATLVSRSFMAMMHADRGYDLSNLLSVRVQLPDFLFKPDRRVEVVNQTLARARTLPHVTRIAFADVLPLSSGETMTGFTMPSLRPPLGVETYVSAVRRVVSQDYFRALGISAASGRTFDESDTASSARVVVVNRSFASKFLSDRQVGDKLMNFFQADNVEYEVVGVIADVTQKGLTDSIQPEIYSLNLQMPASKFGATQNYILRTDGDPRGLVEPLRTILREQDPSIMVDSVMTMEDRLSTTLAKPRLYAVLFSTFALSALLIAGVGLFGVLSYNVSQRSREIAVRTALGASPRNVLALVVADGLGFTIAGVALGLAISFAFVRYLQSMLYGVTPHDLVSVAIVCVSIAAIALLACIVPALRAIRINPVESLKA